MRDLAQPRELAPAELVEDLSRLLLGELVDLLSLVAREKAQRASRDVRIPSERLIGRDEAVAAEGHGVPGDARGRVGTARVELEKRSQVERASRDEALVERLRARAVAGARPQEAAVASVERVDRVVEAIRRRRRSSAVFARDGGELELEELLRPERARHAEHVSLDRVRRGSQRDLGRPPNTVSADALEDEATLSRPARRGERREAEVAICPHREHVAERRLELELDFHVDRVRVRVEHADPLAESVREKARPADRQRVRGMPCRPEHRALGMHELKCRDVVLLGVRRQEERPRAVHTERVAREVLRVVVVEAERAHRAERQAPIVLGDEDELVLL